MNTRHLTWILVVAAGAMTPAAADTFTWTPTAAGATYDWFTAGNWNPSTAYPDGAGTVVNLNNDIVGNQNIRLRDDILLGILNIGDNASNFTIGNAGSETFSLLFDSGVAGTAAQLNVTSTATSNISSTLSVPIALNSDLAVNLGTGVELLALSGTGTLATGAAAAARKVTVTGGTSGLNQLTFTGDVTGDGVITNNSNASIIITNTKTFTGTFVLNKGLGGSNTGSLTLTSGGIPNAAEVIVNGFLSGGGITQNGGLLHSGDNSNRTAPGQRFTQNRITVNGGSVTAGGQAISSGSGTLVVDNVSTLDFNSGYSLFTISGNANSGGTRFNVTTMERTVGATAFVRSSTLGGTAQLSVSNAASFLTGGAGLEGSTTMSIIPWMVAANTNGNAAMGDTFATSTATGLRALLTTGEYATTLTAGAASNVSAASVAIANPDTALTINSFRYTTGGSSNIGAGKTLTIASGGLIFTLNNSVIGTSGSAAAGTLQFGTVATPAEGVIWSNGTNTNTIGASLSGTMGITKAGTGTLILTGINTYSGLTEVSGGTLQIGDGTNISNLGIAGDVSIANGATLSLLNGSAIADSAAVTIEQFGLFNGKVNLAAGVNEIVGALYFGTTIEAAGTYGSTLSAAIFKDDTRFSGTGILTVVPEPGSAALLMLGAAAVIRRRHVRR